jgi:hypothetical protein
MAVVPVSLPKQAILPELSFVPYRIPSAIILALPETSINASRSITKANRSIRPSMAQGNLQFIWQCHPKRKLSISSAISSHAQDGHFYNAIFFEHRARIVTAFSITAASARKLTGGRISKAAGRRKNDVKVNMSPPTFGRRRTMPDSLRPAGTKYDFWPCRLSWRASRSSGVSRAKGE